MKQPAPPSTDARPAAQGGLRSRFGRIPWRDPDTHFMALAVFVGLLGGGGAIVFRAITAWITTLLTGRENIVAGAAALPTLQRIVIPAVGGLIGGFIARRFVRTGGTMGIAQIMEVVAVGRRTVRFRQSAARTASSLVVISTGGSEGREGPIIQMAAAFASAVGRWMRVSPERGRILVACGMAAGVAGAYNTPISATLFVTELVIGSFSMAVFGPVVVSAVVSALVSRAIMGDAPLYKVASFQLGSPREILPYIPLGLVAGAGAVFFMRALRRAKRLFHRTGWPDEIRMLIGGAGVGLIGLVWPAVWGNGFEGTNLILASQWTAGALALLCLAKIVATGLTIGSGGVGGVFTPGLMVGAAIGGLFGLGVQHLLPHFSSAPLYCYALLGMGGLLAGTTRAPFLAIIMLFELTDNVSILLPMMVVSVVSILAARIFERESIYVEELREAGVQWQTTPQATAVASLQVKDIMRTDIPLVPQTLRLGEIVRMFMETRFLHLYVGDEQGRLLGIIDLHDLKQAMNDEELSELVIAQDLVHDIPVVVPEELLTSVNEKLWFRDYGQLPVVETAAGRRFLGIVTRRDLLGAIDREVFRNSRLLARIDRSPDGEGGYFELPENHRLAVVDVPADVVGKKLAESRLREDFGVTVLAIRRVDREGIERPIAPAAGEELRRGDRLSVLATDQGLARLRGGPTPAPGFLQR